MSNCERVRAHLNDFIDGTLGAAQAQDLNAHLEMCAACRHEYQALKSTQELVRSLPVPEGLRAHDRVLSRFRQAVPQAQRQQPAPRLLSAWRERVTSLSLAAAATLLLACLAYWRLMPSGETTLPVSGMADVVIAPCSQTLPTSDDLDRMTSLHAVESFTVLNGNEELQQDALADANSRLKVGYGNTH